MKKYLALYMAPLSSIDAMMSTGKEEQEKGMEMWMQWMDAHKESFAEQGAPVGKNMQVTAQGAIAKRNEVVGFSIVQADSHEQATAVFEDCPHLGMEGAWVDVVELMQMDN